MRMRAMGGWKWRAEMRRDVEEVRWEPAESPEMMISSISIPNYSFASVNNHTYA